jgi:hypothetical protein
MNRPRKAAPIMTSAQIAIPAKSVAVLVFVDKALVLPKN